MRLFLSFCILMIFTRICISEPSEALLDAISQVESRGGLDPKAFERSYICWGEYQIQKSCIKDINRIYKSHYNSGDAMSSITARRMCFLYLDYYGKVFKRDTGINPTDRTYARIWNQGYKGMNRPKAIKYWEKIKKHL